MDAEENQKQVFPRRPQPLEIAARFPHSHRRDEAVEVENQKQVFPLSTATGWLFRPNSERRPGGGASLLLQAHCSIRKCYVPDCSPAGFSNSFRLLRWDRILSYISNLCIPGVLSLSLLPDSLRTVLAVKGSLRHTKQRRALDGSGPFLTTFLR